MNAFFIAGNKRSGSSLLVHLLNLHPEIFVSHESDIIWILYNFHAGKDIVPYPADDPGGMSYTLATCRHLLNRQKSPSENFFRIQKELMKKGFSINLRPMEKSGLRWIGDKKPFQYADPELTSFILDILPGARFIHLVRHPFAVARSAKKFMGDGGSLWKQKSPEEIIEMWAFHEKKILKLHHSHPEQIIDVRYEDMCRHTEDALESIFDFLKLDFSDSILEEAARLIKYAPKFIGEVPCSDETLSIMERYGYIPADDFYP
jgi:hypothetical protein